MPSETDLPPRRRRAAHGEEKTPKSSPPPKSSPAPAEVKPKTRSSADKKLAASIAGMYQMAGVAVTGLGLRMGDEGIAGAGVQTVNVSEQLAEAWMDLGDRNPNIKKALAKLTEVSAAGVVISLHVTIAIPILVSRGMIPAEFVAQFSDSVPAEPTPNGNGEPVHTT